MPVPAEAADPAFVRPILAAYASDAPRLIYADYLDESDAPADHARADLIRTQCAAARLPADHPRRPDLDAHAAALLADHLDAWAEPLRGLVVGTEFRRGLLDSVLVGAADFCRHADLIFRRAPVRRVRITDAAAHVERLAGSAHLGLVRELDLCGTDLGNGGVNVLVRSHHVTQLRVLDLSFTGVGDSGLAAVARTPFPHLHSLSVGGGQAVTDRGIEALAAARWFGGLRTLDVSDNRVGPAGMRALAAGALHALKVAANPLGDAGVMALVESPLFGRLVGRAKAFDLRHVDLGPDGVAALAAAAPAAGLVGLDLSANDFGDAGVRALVAGHFDHLRRLTLARVGLTDRGARLLAQSHVMRGLTHLDLAGNRLTQAGVDGVWKHRRDFQTVVDTSGNFASPVSPPAPLADDLGRVLRRLAPGAGGGAGAYSDRPPAPRAPARRDVPR